MDHSFVILFLTYLSGALSVVLLRRSLGEWLRRNNVYRDNPLVQAAHWNDVRTTTRNLASDMSSARLAEVLNDSSGFQELFLEGQRGQGIPDELAEKVFQCALKELRLEAHRRQDLVVEGNNWQQPPVVEEDYW